MKLTLHIGLQKTGTSSIQVMLNSSAKYLKSVGRVFPELPKTDAPKSDVWTSAFRHNCVAGTYADFHSVFEKMTWSEAEVFWQNLRVSGLSPILSAEEFSRQKDFCVLADAISGFEVEIVAYLRRQDKFIESLYNQRNKILLQRADPSFISDDFLTERDLGSFIQKSGYRQLLNFVDLISRLEQAFQGASILIRNFGRDTLVGGDVCADFCNATGLDPEQMNLPKMDANQSVSNATLTKWKSVYLKEGSEAATEFARRTIVEMRSGISHAGDYSILQPSSRDALLEEYQHSNEEIYHRFGFKL